MSGANIRQRRDVLKAVGTTTALSAWGIIGAGGREQPDRHIVGVESSTVATAVRDAAESVEKTIDFGGIGLAVVGTFSEVTRERLQDRSGVRYIEQDAIAHAFGQSMPCGIDRMDADVAHDFEYTGSGTHVAVLDSGIDSDHPDLEANLGRGKSFTTECSDSSCEEPWGDDDGHGTACAGIVGAVDNSRGIVGVAPDTTLHAAKVLGDDGSGRYSDIADALRWTADKGYDVASMSIGGSSSTQTLKDACTYAYSNGVFLVAAAGNYGPCTDCVAYPAAYSEVVAVSAVNCSGDWESYSSQGPAIELAGLAGIETTDDDDDTMDFAGTSAACPHVAGAGALIMGDGYTNTDARDQLAQTAEDLGMAAERQGNGLVNADKALLGEESGDEDSDDGGDGSDGGDDGGGGGGDDHFLNCNLWFIDCSV